MIDSEDDFTIICLRITPFPGRKPISRCHFANSLPIIPFLLKCMLYSLLYYTFYAIQIERCLQLTHMWSETDNFTDFVVFPRFVSVDFL